MSFAERHFYLSARDGEKTRRENLHHRLAQAIRRRDKPKPSSKQQRRGGESPETEIAKIEADLEMPPFPPELAYLWRAYHRLRQRTAMGFASTNPISWQDIDAFVRQTRFNLYPWEVEILEAIDNAFLSPAVKPAAPREKSGMVATASMEDPQAVRSLLRSFGRGKKNKEGG